MKLFMNKCRSLWGQFGGFGIFYCPYKPISIYIRLKFWGQRWGQRVPRKIRVIYFLKLTTN